jgi:uncharacterized membrane protein (DUF441 family)
MTRLYILSTVAILAPIALGALGARLLDKETRATAAGLIVGAIAFAVAYFGLGWLYAQLT